MSSIAKRINSFAFGSVASLLTLLSSTNTLRAEQLAIELGSVTCSECRIDISAHAEWTGSWVGGAEDIDQVDDGRFVFVRSSDGDGFMLVSDQGRALARIGQLGDGLGEYQYIRWVKPFGAYFHIFDVQRRHRTVLNEKLEVHHHNAVDADFAGDVIVINDSTYVINAAIYTSERIGYALHAFGNAGTVLRSFDEMPEGFGMKGSRVRLYRSLARSSDGMIWSAHRTKYIIDLWNAHTGSQELSLVRATDWFPNHDQSSVRDRHNPPLPEIIDVGEDSHGYLWVLIRMASAHWSDAFVETPENAHPEYGDYILDDMHLAYDTRIEVIDIARRRLIASSVVGEAHAFYVNGWLFSLDKHEDDMFVRRQWRVDLRGPVPTS